MLNARGPTHHPTSRDRLTEEDGSPSSCRSGFNSPWRRLVRDEVLNGCTPVLGAGGGGSSPPVPIARNATPPPWCNRKHAQLGGSDQIRTSDSATTAPPSETGCSPRW